MNPKLIFLGFSILLIILAIRLTAFYNNIDKYPQGYLVSIQVQLPDQPKLKVRGQQVSLNLPNSQRAVVIFKLDPLLSYGDTVKLQGKIQYFETSSGDRIAFINYPRFELVEKGTESSLILKVRENIINFFNSNLPQTYSALMLGIVFGIKEEMPAGFYADLQKTGLMHVIAASGMNITMLGGFLSMFFVLFLRRQVALIMTILAILFYAVLAGLEPSIVRAAIMGIIAFSAGLIGRQGSGGIALFLAAFLMLFRSPSLIFDIGFQLSFMATLGLIYLRPIFSLSRRIKRGIGRSIIGDDLVTTLTAQIFTLPILLVNFGSYSLWSIPVNAIVLWTVPILMIVGGISVAAGLIMEPIGKIILYLSIPFLLYFTKVVEFFGSFPGQIEVRSLPILLILGYYLILLALILYSRRKQ